MTVQVRDVPERSRYEATVDGARAGLAAYRIEGDVITFTHTEVEPAYEGQGVGSALARTALDQVRADGALTVVARCPFIAGWIDRHPDYAALLVAP